jgi:hypothetical protein
MADVIYRRGPSTRLPETPADGEILVTTDTGEMYVSVAGEKKKITDTNKMDKFGRVEITEDLGLVQETKVYTAGTTTYVSDAGSRILGESVGLNVRDASRMELRDGEVEFQNYKTNEGLRITGIAIPISNNDAVNKRYVDDAIANMDIPESGGTHIQIITWEAND